MAQTQVTHSNSCTTHDSGVGFLEFAVETIHLSEDMCVTIHM